MKKGDVNFMLVLLIIAFLFFIFSAPLLSKTYGAKDALFSTLGLRKACDETGKTLGHYERELSDLYAQYKDKTPAGSDKESIILLCTEFKKCFTEYSGYQDFCEPIINYDVLLETHLDLMNKLVNKLTALDGVGTYWYSLEPKQYRKDLLLAAWGLEGKGTYLGETTASALQDISDFKRKADEIVLMRTYTSNKSDTLMQIYLNLDKSTTLKTISAGNNRKQALLSEMDLFLDEQQKKAEELIAFMRQRVYIDDGYIQKYTLYLEDAALLKMYDDLIKKEADEFLVRLSWEILRERNLTYNLSDSEAILLATNKKTIQEIIADREQAAKLEKANRFKMCLNLQAGILSEFLKKKGKNPDDNVEFNKMFDYTSASPLAYPLTSQEWADYVSYWKGKKGDSYWDMNKQLSDCMTEFGTSPAYPSDYRELYDLWKKSVGI